MTTRVMMAAARHWRVAHGACRDPVGAGPSTGQVQQASTRRLVTQVARGGGRGGGGFGGRAAVPRGSADPDGEFPADSADPGREASIAAGAARASTATARAAETTTTIAVRASAAMAMRLPSSATAPTTTVAAIGDDCRWLRRRAQATGSRYWWDRYYACIDD